MQLSIYSQQWVPVVGLRSRVILSDQIGWLPIRCAYFILFKLKTFLVFLLIIYNCLLSTEWQDLVNRVDGFSLTQNSCTVKRQSIAI